MPDLLLHQDPALERGPGDLVPRRCRAVLGVEIERPAAAGPGVGVHEAVGRAGHHEPSLPGGQVLDSRFQPVGRIFQRHLQFVASAHQQRVGVRVEARLIQQLWARRSGRYAVGLEVGEVDRLEAGRVAELEAERAGEAVDGKGCAVEGLVTAERVLEWTKSRGVELELVEGGAGVLRRAEAGVGVTVGSARFLRIGLRIANREPKPGRYR